MTGHETPDTVPLPIGHRIPSELLYHILHHYLCDMYENSYLGSWTLVCREWARILRPQKFDLLEIHSHREARDFIDLVKSTSLPTELRIGRCVHILLLSQDLSTWSWLHTILFCKRKELLPGLGIVSISLTNRDAKLGKHGAVMPKTIYHHLPRTLPTALVGGLSLNFKGSSTLESLMRLSSSVRTQWNSNFYQCALDSGSFKDIVPHTIPRYLLRAPLPGCPQVNVRPLRNSKFPTIWPLVWFVTPNQMQLPLPTTQQLPWHNTLSLSHEEALRLVCVVKHVIDNCQCFMCTTPASSLSEDAKKTFRCSYHDMEHQATGIVGAHYLLKFASPTHRLEFKFSHHHQLEYISVHLVNWNQIHYASRNDVKKLVFKDPQSLQQNLDFDLKSLDKMLSAFLPSPELRYGIKLGLIDSDPPSPSVELNVAWMTSRDELISHVKAQMPLTNATGALEVNVRVHQIINWDAAPKPVSEPSSDGMQPSLSD